MIGFFLKVVWVLQILNITSFSYKFLIPITICYFVLSFIAQYIFEEMFGEEDEK